MLFSQGWLFSPRFQYSTFLWTVQDTNQVAVGGALYYNFGKYMTLGAGWNAYPGTQSLQGSHPYWESYDRVMADEFFPPYFSQGVFAQGTLFPRLEYRWMVGNNNSNLDVPEYRGFWLQGEGYGRKLDNFEADAPLPLGAARDFGFYVQMAQMIVPDRIELYASTSYIFSRFGHPKEFIFGGNYYPGNTRNLRLNLQLINVDHSPVRSTFGFYTGQIRGQVVSIGSTTLY
jgi:hypothetical protein